MTDDTAFDRERIAKLKERAHKASSRTGIGDRTAWLQYHSALQAAFERGTLVFVAQPKPDDDLADRLRTGLAGSTELPSMEEVSAAYLAALDQIADLHAAVVAERNRLRAALGWFLNDTRFVVSVGGNPNAVDEMIRAARAALDPAP